MNDCLFCKIAAGTIKPDIVYEDDQILAFRDINPQAPVHILIIPKRHIATLNDLDDLPFTGKLFQAAAYIAQAEGLADDGYRVVINCNAHGGQTVYHVHIHLLGGRQLHWPPG
ncbi:MAG: histidine triad nucleotide-binding protein [Methylococcaceae bacterium]|nr:histidine triad nucleotide-binding protein [Methylococcaceae bacterium]